MYPNMMDFFLQANTPRRIKGLLGPRSADCLLIVPVSDISLVSYFPLNPNHIGYFLFVFGGGRILSHVSVNKLIFRQAYIYCAFRSPPPPYLFPFYSVFDTIFSFSLLQFPP